MHRNAKLTPAGRRLLVQRVTTTGWSISRAAAAQGISRTTAHKWLRRHQAEGPAGLVDRSSRPHHCPRQLAPHRERRILRARRILQRGPHWLARPLRCPRSTIYAVLRRHGLTRLTRPGPPLPPPVRYVRERPGDLVHLDTKKLGRIPAGGGHRMHGWQARHTTARGQGSEVLHVAVDDTSRLAFVQLLPDERGVTCAQFLRAATVFFATHGIRIARILTDNARAYTADRRFQATLTELGIQHRRTRPYRPQTNGKAERFIQTALREWAYRRLYTTNQARAERLPHWLQVYNHHRPHTSLGGRAPLQVLRQ